MRKRLGSLSKKKAEEEKLSYIDFCNLIINNEKNQVCAIGEGSKEKGYYQHCLSEYYVSSSHNTYLMGNQLTDDVDVYAYINAIKMGCRSFEIDCWDGNQKDTIKVCHGFTLTHFSSTLTFQDVITVIRDYAFVENPLPVLLSLEIHCKPSNHLVMAEKLKNILGKRLYVLRNGKVQNLDKMMNKVLIKVKRHFSDEDIHQSGKMN